MATRNWCNLLIANCERELLASADEGLTGSERVRVDRYSADELVSIMDPHIKWDLEEDVISEFLGIALLVVAPLLYSTANQ